MVTAGEAVSRFGEHLSTTNTGMGVGFTGVFNVESGFAEIKNKMFNYCSQCAQSGIACDACGRQPACRGR